MRTVLDNINASIYVTDPDSMEILFANKKLKEQAGYDIEGKICWSVIHGLDAPCEHCLKPKLLGSKNKPSGLFNREAYDSRQNRWYECADAAIEWVDGRLVYMEYATDITDRKKAEVALRQSEEMYRQLTVASPDAIVVSDFAGKPVFLSDKAKEMFLVGDKNISGLRLFRYVHPHDLRGAFETFRMFAQDNVAFLPQLLLKRNDGSEFFGEISSASVKNATGDTEFIIMIIRDITDRKMNEIDLINAKEKAEESDKLKSAFLANMSHEIRTPINGIIGFLNFLGDENLSRKKRQEYINVVNNSSTQLVKLIDDIIDVAKIEAKQMSIRPVPFHLNDFMRELQVFFETYLQANNKDKIALVLDDSEFIDSCVTYVDPMRLRQVLSNLIGNAVKFTEKGYIRFGYRQISSSKLEFTVEDSGIGLAEDQLEIIFERFRQAELNNDRHYGGTGLGLTISRSLVYLMGGNLNVESIKGVGSTFHFTISYLPVTPEEEHLFNEKEADSEILGKPQKNSFILMVEPEYMKSSYYSKLLADTGAELIVVQTIKEWIDAITQRKYIDIVLVNSTVFENEDMETIKQVKSVRAGLPLIMFVPACDDYYMQISSILQCNKIIREPADMSKLKEILKKYL
jgi:PAS domain S-box-containing protein